MVRYHVAQLNVGRMLKPKDDPSMIGFTGKLDEINALAEQSPGFVWRLKDESGNATNIKPFPDETMAVNLSVWENMEVLYDFVYKTAHVRVLNQRKLWFEHLGESHMVLWWVPAGHIPTTEEAKERLDMIRSQGPSEKAFTFKVRFPPPTDVV